MFGFIILIVCMLWAILLLGCFIVYKTEANGSWLLRSFPYWLGGYCVAQCLVIPDLLFSPYKIWVPCYFCLLGIMSICALMMIACYVVFIVRKQWANVGRMTGLGALLVVFSFVTLLFAGMGAGHEDHFGRQHPIPADLSYYEPGGGIGTSVDSRQHAEQIARERKIYIAGDWMGYEYAIWVPALEEDGVLMLRAYEAVTNDPLTLRYYHEGIEASACEEDFVYICYNQIAFDEGIPEEPYAARIELWFVPKDKAHKERMLSSAIYKVEAWAR